jgi:hypothetical protein
MPGEGECLLVNFFYAHHGDASAIWSIDGVHTGYLPPPSVSAKSGR